MELKAGCIVHHNPTKENWWVLGISGDRLCVGGWPPTIAKIADCEVLPQPIQPLTAEDIDYRRKTFGAEWE